MNKETKKRNRIIIGSHFNTRTGREGRAVKIKKEFKSEIMKSRKSKDQKINKEGRKLVDWLEERR